jgi:hypothetical protein
VAGDIRIINNTHLMLDKLELLKETKMILQADAKLLMFTYGWGSNS